MAAEDYHDMADYVDQSYYDNYEDDRQYVPRVRRRVTKEKMKMNQNDIRKNKFYVGSNTIFGRNWGHATMDKAIKHAQELMDEQGLEETFIVQIVRVCKRQKNPIKVTKV